ncbi:MAG: hypothetical protein J7464_16465, partial [Chloroflexus sp.]|nr:hypothetical protein [Chloroflexus sp.]
HGSCGRSGFLAIPIKVEPIIDVYLLISFAYAVYLDCQLTTTDTTGTIAGAKPPSSPGGADGRLLDDTCCCRDRHADGTPGAAP